MLHFSWNSAACTQVFMLLLLEKHRDFENLDWLVWNISSEIGRCCKSLWFWGRFALSHINKSVTLVGHDVSHYQGRRSKNSLKEYNVWLCDLMYFVIRKGYFKKGGLRETQPKTPKNSHYVVREVHKPADRRDCWQHRSLFRLHSFVFLYEQGRK